MLYKLLKSVIVLSLFIPIFMWINKLSDINVAQAEYYIKTTAQSVQSDVQDRYESIKSTINTLNSQGIDVSNNNGKIVWSGIKGVDFAIIKATGGHTFVDPMFKSNWEGAKSLGVKRGAYHFYYASDDPISQSRNFLDTVGDLREFDLPAIVDVEILDHADEELLMYGLTHFLEILEKKTKKIPIIYSDLSFYKSYLMSDKLKKYPIWIADYEKIDLKDLQKQIPNRDIVMWQYTSKGKITGIDGFVDRSIFYGDLNSFIQKSNIGK